MQLCVLADVLQVVNDALIEQSLAAAAVGTRFQFERVA
jgi:hypothetical protein